MSITNFSAARRAGFKITNRGIKKAAAIAMTKVGTRTLKYSLSPASFYASGAGATEVTDGMFAGVTLVDAATNDMQTAFKLPAEMVATESVVITIYWKSASTTGDARFSVALGSKADSEDTAASDTQVVATTVNSTANKLNKSQVTFGQAVFTAADWIGLLIQRAPAHGDDDLGANLNVIGVVMEFTGRG